MDGNRVSGTQCYRQRIYGISNACHRVPLVAQSVKNLPAMQETQVQSLDQEDLLEKEW